MQLPKKNKGYLSLITVILMVIAGVVSVSASHFFVADSSGNIYDVEGTKALFIAEAGLQGAGYFLLGDTISGRIACNSISGYAPLTNTSVGDGVLDVDQLTSAYYVPTATLSSSITSGATTITVSSTVGYATNGRIMIDREIMNYRGKTSTTFTNITRGRAGSIAAAHASGSRVSQYQCTVNSVGYIPNQIAPRVKRTIRGAFQLQEAWVVGEDGSNEIRIARWNRPAQTVWNDATQAEVNDEALRGITMLNHGEGWIVGDVKSGDFNIMRYDPVLQNWQDATGIPTPGSNYERDLWDVHAVSHNEAWAVGERSNHSGNSRRFTILKWTGTQWCLLGPSATGCTSATIPTGPPSSERGVHLYGIEMLDTDNDGDADIGFAVGQNGRILSYDGSTEAWDVDTTAGGTLRAVDLVSTTEAWAVGVNTTLRQWNGSSWSNVSLSGSNVTLYDIEMVDRDNDGAADYGYIVGASGRAYVYDGASWSSDFTLTSGTLYAVETFGQNDVWIVGTDNLYYHFDGITLNTFSSAWNETMYDMATIAPIQKYKSQSSWEEIFH